jgi:hypothetical protein
MSIDEISRELTIDARALAEPLSWACNPSLTSNRHITSIIEKEKSPVFILSAINKQLVTTMP